MRLFCDKPNSARLGTGEAIGHHGELLQGVFKAPDGRLQRGLLTLPCSELCSFATFWPRVSEPRIRVRPSDRRKAVRAAEVALSHLGVTAVGGDLTIESAISLGRGYGSSTADVIATIRSVASAFGANWSPATEACLAVAAEEASDSTPFSKRAVLFAQREGRVIEYFSGDLPHLLVVGFDAAPDGAVDTLALPRARYDSEEIETFGVLRGFVQRAVADQDSELLARVATASAIISQRYLPIPDFPALLALKGEFHASGVQVAHSGTLAGILFDPHDRSTPANARALHDRLVEEGRQRVRIFTV